MENSHHTPQGIEDDIFLSSDRDAIHIDSDGEGEAIHSCGDYMDKIEKSSAIVLRHEVEMKIY